MKKNLWQRGDRGSGAQPSETCPSLSLPLGIDLDVAWEPDPSHRNQACLPYPRGSTQ